uniref:Uncharacterized protein n=1 Tax=Timema bartmani TaxID=61472 RepID=A0A7R9F1F0_9NEOP|nr:unnamed protein product [Timema bartmani]
MYRRVVTSLNPYRVECTTMYHLAQPMSSRVYHHVVTSLNLCRVECTTMYHLAQPMSSRVYHHVVTSLNLCRGDGDTHAPVLTPPWTPAGRGLTPGPCKPSWGTDRPAVGEEVESGMETSLNVRTKGQVPPPPPSFGCGGSYQERPLTQLTRAPCTVTPLPQVPALKFDRRKHLGSKSKVPPLLERLDARATKPKQFLFMVPPLTERLEARATKLKPFSPRFLHFQKGYIPTQVPPLTPGTNKKMTEALKASFASWEKEQLRLNIVKGQCNTDKTRMS